MVKKQGKHKGYKKFEHALEDGVHASDDTKQLWAGLILDATKRNRGWKAPKPTILAKVPAQTDSDSLGGEHFSLTQFVLTHMCFTLCNSPPPTYFSETRHSIQGFHTQSSSIPRGQWTNWPRVFDGAAPRKTNDFVVKRYLWRHQPVSQSRLPGGDCSSAKQST